MSTVPIVRGPERMAMVRGLLAFLRELVSQITTVRKRAREPTPEPTIDQCDVFPGAALESISSIIRKFPSWQANS